MMVRTIEYTIQNRISRWRWTWLNVTVDEPETIFSRLSDDRHTAYKSSVKGRLRMGKSTKLAEVYLRFIHLTEALREQADLPALEPLEERILMIVADANFSSERLSVKDLMSMSELGSPAMLHGRLKSMREKGWIFLAETEDARRKQLELTKDTLAHFDKMARCMLKAAEA
jgi:DNA-binding MarR family transcriptional regulator